MKAETKTLPDGPGSGSVFSVLAIAPKNRNDCLKLFLTDGGDFGQCGELRT